MTEKMEVSLYGGDVGITFYPDSHRYKLSGHKDYLISVTAITGVVDKSRVLVKWAVGLAGAYIRKYFEESKVNKYTAEELEPVIAEALAEHEKKRDHAADVGSMVHKWAEEFTTSVLSGTESPKIDATWPDEVLQGINAYIDWYTAHNVKIEVSERMIYSKEYGYVGLCDAVGTVDGKKYLIDYKTAKGIYFEHSLQVSAYLFAYEEETGEKLDGAMIVKFGKEDGNFEVKEIGREELVSDYQAFLGALAIKKRMKEIGAY